GTLTAGNAVSASTSNFGSCSITGQNPDGWSLAGASSAVIGSHTDSFTCPGGLSCAHADCGPTATCATCPSCQITNTTNFTDTLQLSGGSVSCSAGGGFGTACAGAPGGPGWANQVSSANPVAFVGLNGGTSWGM